MRNAFEQETNCSLGGVNQDKYDGEWALVPVNFRMPCPALLDSFQTTFKIDLRGQRDSIVGNAIEADLDLILGPSDGPASPTRSDH